MNIAYVMAGLWPSHSPSTTFATMAASGFAEAGHECIFFIKRNSPHDATNVFRSVFGREPPSGLTVRQMPRAPFFLRSNRLFYWRVYAELSRLARAGAIDAVMSRSCTFLPWLARLHKSCGVSTWFESHDFYADLAVRDDLRSGERLRESRLERAFLPAISGLVCLQHAQAEQYRRVFPGLRIVVARTGAEAVVRTPLEDRRSLAYVGSLDPHKGVAGLLEAASRSRTRPPLLVVGGKGRGEIAAVMAVAQRCGYADHVEVTGWTDKSTMDRYLRTARIGAVPLTDTFFNRYLTSPLKLFDFYRYGIPVLAADLPTLRELVVEPDTGFFYQPGSVDSLAAAIDAAFGLAPARYAAMVENAYAHAEELQWRNRAAALAAVFQSGGAAR